MVQLLDLHPTVYNKEVPRENLIIFLFWVAHSKLVQRTTSFAIDS